MTNNLEYVKTIINEINKDSGIGTKKAILNFMKNVDIMGFVLLKQEFDNFNILEYAAKNKKWNAFLSCYTELLNINMNNPINDIKMVSLNVLKTSDNAVIKKYLNLIIEKCNYEYLLLTQAIIELPKNIRDEKLKFILDILKENDFDFNVKKRIRKYYNTLLNEAIENPDWSNEEIELLLQYTNKIDKENINIDRIVESPSKIEWLIKYGINIHEELSIPHYKSYFNVLIANKNLTSETLELILSKNININEIKIKEYGYTEEKDLFITHLLNSNFEVCFTLLSKGKDINNLVDFKTSDILYNFYKNMKNNTIEIQKKLLYELIKNPNVFDNDFNYLNLLSPLMSLYMMKDLNGDNLVIELLKNKTISKEVFKSTVIRFCIDRYEIEFLNNYMDMLQVFNDNEKFEILDEMLLTLENVNYSKKGVFNKQDLINNVSINKSLLEQKRLETCFDKKENKYKVKQRL